MTSFDHRIVSDRRHKLGTLGTSLCRQQRPATKKDRYHMPTSAEDAIRQAKEIHRHVLTQYAFVHGGVRASASEKPREPEQADAQWSIVTEQGRPCVLRWHAFHGGFTSADRHDFHSIGSLRVRAVNARNLGGTRHEDAIVSLLSNNMKSLYESSRQGWNLQDKTAELFDADAYFALVHNDDGAIVAFANWRFDVEECESDDPCARPDEDVVEVLYCYEVQVAPPYRQQKLGMYLMKLLENVARSTAMRKVMLTAFTANTAALQFYQRMGYSIDRISPSNYIPAGDIRTQADYEILSKAV